MHLIRTFDMCSKLRKDGTSSWILDEASRFQLRLIPFKLCIHFTITSKSHSFSRFSAVIRSKDHNLISTAWLLTSIFLKQQLFLLEFVFSLLGLLNWIHLFLYFCLVLLRLVALESWFLWYFDSFISFTQYVKQS